MSTVPSYGIIIDLLFNAINYLRITPTGGSVVTAVGDVLPMYDTNITIKDLTQNSATFYVSGIIMVPYETDLVRVTFTGTVETDANKDGCSTIWCYDCASVSGAFFDAYLTGVHVQPGYYLVSVKITVQSGTFVLS